MHGRNLGSIVFNDESYIVEKFHYFSGRLGLILSLDSDRSKWMSATLDIDSVKKNEGEVIVKSHDDKKGLLESLIDGGIVKKQTVPITLGYNKVFICKINENGV